MVRSIASKNGGIRPGVLITSLPDGASTLRISATAAGPVFHEHQAHLAQRNIEGGIRDR